MFNVAGGNRPGLITEMSEADWDFTVALCLKSVFFGVKHAASWSDRVGNAGYPRRCTRWRWFERLSPSMPDFLVPLISLTFSSLPVTDCASMRVSRSNACD